MKWHPDRQKNDADREKAQARFIDISKAYEVLSDAEKRRIYDEVGEAGINGGPSGGPGGHGGGRRFEACVVKTGDRRANCRAVGGGLGIGLYAWSYRDPRVSIPFTQWPGNDYR